LRNQCSLLKTRGAIPSFTMAKKKKSNWGGTREGAGRKPEKKTGKKILWLGLRWFPDELADVLAALKQEGITNKSLFVVNAAVEVARRLLKNNIEV